MTDNYDRIARFYEVDMAQNMRFDDVGFYTGLCRQYPGRVLELGCGSGRILLSLMQAGIEAAGVDASAGMLAALQRKASALSLTPSVSQMDIRELALPDRFDVILCPYSLITYITGDADVSRVLHAARSHLRAGGRLIIDAFVPRPVTPHTEFKLDYRRPFGGGMLARWKRIRPTGPSTNRIERRYELTDASGRLIDEIEVEETIRPFPPEELRDAVCAATLVPEHEWWDYGSRATAAEAQFYTLAARWLGQRSPDPS